MIGSILIGWASVFIVATLTDASLARERLGHAWANASV